MDNKKKVLAAISAVMTYIRTAEEAASMQAAAYNNPACSVPFKLWGISGRLDMMQRRTLMQMKAFHKKS